MDLRDTFLAGALTLLAATSTAAEARRDDIEHVGLYNFVVELSGVAVAGFDAVEELDGHGGDGPLLALEDGVVTDALLWAWVDSRGKPLELTLVELDEKGRELSREPLLTKPLTLPTPHKRKSRRACQGKRVDVFTDVSRGQTVARHPNTDMRPHCHVLSDAPLGTCHEPRLLPGLDRPPSGKASSVVTFGKPLNSVTLSRKVCAQKPRCPEFGLLRGKDQGPHGKDRSRHHIALQSFPTRIDPLR